jgi:hypothetical protein
LCTTDGYDFFLENQIRAQFAHPLSSTAVRLARQKQRQRELQLGVNLGGQSWSTSGLPTIHL